MTNTPPENFDDNLASLAGLYALDALDGEDLDRFEAYLATHPEVMDEVRSFHDTTVRLADVVAAEPPPGLRDRVLADISTTRQDAPVVSLAERRVAGRSRPFLAAAAAVAVLAAGLGGFLLGNDRAPESVVASALARPGTKVVPLLAGDDPTAQGHLVVSKSTGEVIVVSSQMAPPAAGRTYELWRLDADGAHNAGLFTTDKDGKVETSIGVDLDGATGYAITDEPAGGSDAPTTPVLMSATLA